MPSCFVAVLFCGCSTISRRAIYSTESSPSTLTAYCSQNNIKNGNAFIRSELANIVVEPGNTGWDSSFGPAGIPFIPFGVLAFYNPRVYIGILSKTEKTPKILKVILYVDGEEVPVKINDDYDFMWGTQSNYGVRQTKLKGADRYLSITSKKYKYLLPDNLKVSIELEDSKSSSTYHVEFNAETETDYRPFTFIQGWPYNKCENFPPELQKYKNRN